MVSLEKAIDELQRAVSESMDADAVRDTLEVNAGTVDFLAVRHARIKASDRCTALRHAAENVLTAFAQKGAAK